MKTISVQKLIFYSVILWILGWIFVDYNINPEERGAFGDKFGFINSLFSGLALAGIVYSLILQQKEIQDQKEEIRESREEFRDQKFQSTFFNLLKTQQQIANEIDISIHFLSSYDKEGVKHMKGRQFFIQSKHELDRIYKVLDHNTYSEYHPFDPDFYDIPYDEESDASLHNTLSIAYTFSYYDITREDWERAKQLEGLEKAKFVYTIFFNKFNFVIGHYFRHLYHIYSFIENIENEKKSVIGENEKKLIEKNRNDFLTFSNFIQAQMSLPELFLVFYNSLTFPKMQELIIKYNALENLHKETLLKKEHNCVSGINLKSKKDLYK